MKKEDVCPYCGGTEMVLGRQIAKGGVRPEKISIKEIPLHHIICANCGTVVRSYVEYPEQL